MLPVLALPKSLGSGSELYKTVLKDWFPAPCPASKEDRRAAEDYLRLPAPARPSPSVFILGRKVRQDEISESPPSSAPSATVGIDTPIQEVADLHC